MRHADGHRALGLADGRGPFQPGGGGGLQVNLGQDGAQGGQAQTELGAGSQRWKRAEQRVDERAADPVEARVQVPPRVPVTRRERVEARGGDVDVARQDACGTTDQRVGEDGRRIRPPQPVGLEAEPPHRRRHDRERIERAKQIVSEAGRGDLGGADRAARLAVGLEHQHVPAGIGEDIGGDEAVRPCADDDRIGIVHVRHVRSTLRGGAGMRRRLRD